MAIVLETEGSILSIQIQLKPISYAYINATQINVLISNEIQCKYNTNTLHTEPPKSLSRIQKTVAI